MLGMVSGWSSLPMNSFMHAGFKTIRIMKVYSPLEPNSGDRPQDDYMKVPIKGGIRLPPVVLSVRCQIKCDWP
jgi:hypothetical protein